MVRCKQVKKHKKQKKKKKEQSSFAYLKEKTGFSLKRTQPLRKFNLYIAFRRSKFNGANRFVLESTDRVGHPQIYPVLYKNMPHVLPSNPQNYFKYEKETNNQ